MTSSSNTRKVPISLPQLPRKDCAGVKFWNEDSFDEHLKLARKGGQSGESEQSVKKKRAAPGEGTNWALLEDANGYPVPLKRADRMRHWARGLFETMRLEVGDENVPASWDSHTPLYWRQTFVVTMEAEFEELRFCDDHWKAEKLGIYTYSMWQTSRRKAAKTRDLIKGEDTSEADSKMALFDGPTGDDSGTTPTADQVKRHLSEVSDGALSVPAKRQKTDSVAARRRVNTSLYVFAVKYVRY